MHKKEIVELTNMCMIIDEKTNKILCQDRLKNDWPGLTLPGGHVENGEPFIKSVIREVKEETGLTIYDLKLEGIVSWYNKALNERCVIFLYKTTKYKGKLIQSSEGINKWLTLEEIKKGHMAPDFEEILSIYLHEDGREEYFCDDPEKKKIIYL